MFARLRWTSGYRARVPARPLLVVRADGGVGVGVGHLSRCLALVQAWTDRGGASVLAADDPPAFWAEQYLAEECSVVEPGEAPVDAAWWVEDGYQLPSEVRHRPMARTLLIDDQNTRGTAGRGAAVVLDQNLGADVGAYPNAGAHLIGPRYALLRRGIRDAPLRSSVADVARRVVVVLGGSPTPAVRALATAVASDDRLCELEMRVLDGTQDVAAELVAADLALAAAGTVSWELCRAGVPSVLVAVAPNQVALVEQLVAHGVAVGVDAEPSAAVAALLVLARDASARGVMSARGQALVDGKGARRVVCRLRSELLALQDVGAEDADLLLEWANDAGTRAASFSSDPISEDEHRRWLTERLGRAGSASYLARDVEGALVGLVRLDAVEGGHAEVGVTVAPARRGQGWGGALVDAGCRRWASAHGAGRIVARIKVGNAGSIAAFVDADFDEVRSSEESVLRYARTLDGDERRS